MEGAALHRYHPPMVAVGTTQEQGRSAQTVAGAAPGGGARARTSLGSLALRLGGALFERRAEVAAVFLAALLYLPALGYGFVFDDLALIDAEGHPLRLGGAVPYRPLRYASYLLDSALGGAPLVYHAHNVLLHALVAALVVALARRLGASRLAALAGGLLLACHPLSVEAAAYVSGRRDLLCVGLGLAAVLAHLSGRALAALGLVVLSAAAKESGLIFFAPVVLASACGLGRAPWPRAFPLGLLVSTGVAATAALGFVLAYGAVGPWSLPVSMAGLVLPGRVTLHYLGSLVGLVSPAPEYPQLLAYMDRVEAGDVAAVLLGAGGTLLVAVAAIASLALCARARRSGRRREEAFVVAWTMTVVSALAVWGGLHEPGVDRHAYLLLAPLGLVLAGMLSRLRRSASWNSAMEAENGPWPSHKPPGSYRLALVAVAGMLLASAAASRDQMEVWRSEHSLWSHATTHAAASPRAHANMARSLALDGQLEAAARHMETALEADPDDPLLYVGRAVLRCARGRVPLARRDLRRALQLERRGGGSAQGILALAGECEGTDS